MPHQASRFVTQDMQQPIPDRHLSIYVVRRVKGVVDEKMTYLFNGLAMNAADALFEETFDERQQGLLERQFNITRALKTRARAYQEEFSTLMNYSWANLIKEKDEFGVADPAGELSPVLRALAVGNADHFKVLLEVLRQRFSVLVDQDLEFHPLLPGNFQRCFWYATEKLNLSYEERIMLLPLFNRFVMDRFGQVLSIANQNLIDMGVSI